MCSACTLNAFRYEGIIWHVGCNTSVKDVRSALYILWHQKPGFRIQEPGKDKEVQGRGKTKGKTKEAEMIEQTNEWSKTWRGRHGKEDRDEPDFIERQAISSATDVIVFASHCPSLLLPLIPSSSLHPFLIHQRMFLCFFLPLTILYHYSWIDLCKTQK